MGGSSCLVSRSRWTTTATCGLQGYRLSNHTAGPCVTPVLSSTVRCSPMVTISSTISIPTYHLPFYAPESQKSLDFLVPDAA